MYTPPSDSSPPGIYGASHRGAAFDRAHIRRGFARSKDTIPNGWDCPVVIGMAPPAHRYKKMGKRLANGVEIGRIKFDAYSNVDLRTLGYLEVHINIPIYKRFQQLNCHWEALKFSRAVLCRAEPQTPEQIFKAGHGSPMTCARVVYRDADEFCHWLLASGTGQYRCPNCDACSKSCVSPCNEM